MSTSFSRTAGLVLLLVAAVAVAGFAEYDQDHVVQVMRDNVGLMGEISGAAEAEDWVLAAQKLFALADGMVAIMAYDPPRGTKADWDATMMSFVNAAYIGIGACGTQDGDALQEAITELRNLNREGHRAHK